MYMFFCQSDCMFYVVVCLFVCLFVVLSEIWLVNFMYWFCACCRYYIKQLNVLKTLDGSCEE
jgi:hypothetical protein